MQKSGCRDLRDMQLITVWRYTSREDYPVAESRLVYSGCRTYIS